MKYEVKVNSSSLCHFTKHFKTLKHILSEGIRFSYAYELFFEASDMGTAIPMVSFCDIPISRAAIHMTKYGCYMIGLDKKFIIDYYNAIINPVIYVHSDNLQKAINTISNYDKLLIEKECDLVSSASESLIKDESLTDGFIARFKELSNDRFNLAFILGLTKPYFDRLTKQCFYDEREWRAFWPDWSRWHWNITRSKYDLKKKEWNQTLVDNKDNFITAPSDCLCQAITHIIVKKESQRNEVIDYIKNSKLIFGNNDVSNEERILLISKVSSFEQVVQDY